MDLVKCGLTPFCSCLQSPVVRKDMSYVFCTEEKLDDLDEARTDLMARKGEINREQDDPKNKGKLPSQLDYDTEIEAKDKEVNKLLDEYRKGCCVAGCCFLNCYSKYTISRHAIKLTEDIEDLKGKLSKITFWKLPPPKKVARSPRIVGKVIGSKVEIARRHLENEAVGMVGIQGMGGVGKTTLLEKIKDSLLNDGNMGFNHVISIEATQDIQLGELRKKIAKQLKLRSSANKDDILEALKTKNFVLLLDNIWGEIDLAELGIPHPDSNDISIEKHKRKVIFTTRSENVCYQMGVRDEETIKMECMEPDEAWELFKDNVNLDVIESDERIKSIAKQVMNMCRGLPLALKVIGKAMSNKKTLQEWESALRLLRESSIQKVQGVEESLFPLLKFSYDNLTKPDNIKKCFLCASMLRLTTKDELFECWMGLGLIGDFVNLQNAYDKAETILKILEESSLLCYSHDSDFVYSHDVIYEMAVWIASDCGMNRNKWIVKRRVQPEETPTNDSENWRFARRVILDHVGIKVLPVLSHRCSKLLCLVIRYNRDLQNIPEGFFRQMPNLVYLDLSGTSIEELPKDIQYLVDLQYLNISNTKISSLPNELLKLKNLQYLICRNLWPFKKTPDGLISKLLKLKVLDLYPHGWIERPEELKMVKKHIKAIGMGVASQDVLQQLSCLPTTRVSIQNIDNLTSLSFDTLSCKNHGFLHELKIVSCTHLNELVMNGSQTHLSELSFYNVQELQRIIWKEVPPQDFFHKLKSLSIWNCNLASFPWVLHLPCLSSLFIMNCGKIEKLFYVEEEDGEIQQISERPTFPSLHSLDLRGLTNLISISKVALDFSELSFLTVQTCPNLKKLPFKPGIINNKPFHIICEREWWESLEWDDVTIPSHLSTTFFRDYI